MPLSVGTTKEGQIEITGEDAQHEMAMTVTISPDQVDLLIEWLKEARTELQGQTV
jgi:hypothetical protein